jgi:hypothetical protein
MLERFGLDDIPRVTTCAFGCNMRALGKRSPGHAGTRNMLMKIFIEIPFYLFPSDIFQPIKHPFSPKEKEKEKEKGKSN